MSDARAIAAVTAVIQRLLHDAFIAGDVASLVGADVPVSALPPDRLAVGENEASQVNVFLHAVTPNQGWRNQDARSHDATGQRIANPMLALDLHYLVTAYGAEEHAAELLLGHAMLALHERPVLTPEMIQATLADPAHGALAGCGLDDQSERIRLVPEPLGAEERSQLWSALQAQQRTSAAYLASVVLIEPRLPIGTPLPVTTRRLVVRAARPPRIDRIAPATIATGETLVIHGSDLAGDGVRVRFGGVDVVPTAVTSNRIELTAVAAIRAGIQPVHVIHQTIFDTPDDPHRGAESNVAAVALAPRITTVMIPPPTIARGATLTLAVDPPIVERQRVELLLGARNVPATPHVGAFPASTVNFTIPADASVGFSLARVRVDGVASRVEVDTTEGSPTFGQIVGPRVEVTP